MNQPPNLQTQLRVTKYDPALRDERGAFTGDDWTSISDVGASFDGTPLLLDRYLEVEAQHLRVVAAFLEESEVEVVLVRGAEAFTQARWWPAEGEELSRLEAVDVVREQLRERGFCRLEATGGVYVHVGWDYYLYIGGQVPCERTLEVARRAGLFVDPDFVSPYQVDSETGNL
jgi:hypothetical protein